MAAPYTTYTQKIDPNSVTGTIGVAYTRGGIITLDEDVREAFKMLHVGIGGNILVYGLDGNILPLLGVSNDTWIPVLGTKVVSAANIDGDPYTTICSQITWNGGK